MATSSRFNRVWAGVANGAGDAVGDQQAKDIGAQATFIDQDSDAHRLFFLSCQSSTHCLITHCQKGNFDHLEGHGKKWLRQRKIPVICTPHDAEYLRKRGLNAQVLPESHHQPSPFFGRTIKIMRCTHGEGLVGMLMEHGVGYFIEIPGEPSLYLPGDTVLTATIREFVLSHQPDESVLPAGGARMAVGKDIIMGVEDVIAFTQLAHGTVIANHLEAISHCPVTRKDLNFAATRAGVISRLRTPADGDTVGV